MNNKEKTIYGIVILIIGLMIKVNVSAVFGSMLAIVGAVLLGFAAGSALSDWYQTLKRW